MGREGSEQLGLQGISGGTAGSRKGVDEGGVRSDSGGFIHTRG